MPELSDLIALELILIMVGAISAATGFGAAVIAIPLCSLFLPVKLVIPLIALMSTCSCVYLSLREHQDIHWPAWRRVLLYVLLGYPIGSLGYHYLPMTSLRYTLALFVLGVAGDGLYRVWKGRTAAHPGPMLSRVLLFLGGIVHGALASSGPLIVAYLVNAVPDRHQFRATLYFLWVVLNGLFMIVYFLGPEADLAVLKIGALVLPAMIAGILIGERIHRAASDKVFRVAVLVILVIAGVSQFFK